MIHLRNDSFLFALKTPSFMRRNESVLKTQERKWRVFRCPNLVKAQNHRGASISRQQRTCSPREVYVIQANVVA